MVRPKFAPKRTLSRGPIPKPHYMYLPHPWTRPTYIAKRHPDPIRRFSTMHWTDRRTDRLTHRPTDRPRESLTTIGRCAPRATRPSNNTSILVKLLFLLHFAIFEVGRVANLAGYRIRVPGRYYPAGSGYCRIRVFNM